MEFGIFLEMDKFRDLNHVDKYCFMNNRFTSDESI
jgi:hypothetical protein